MRLTRLKLARMAQGMSGRELAKKAGIKPSTLSMIENGHQSPRMSTQVKISDALGYPLEVIFKEQI